VTTAQSDAESARPSIAPLGFRVVAAFFYIAAGLGAMGLALGVLDLIGVLDFGLSKGGRGHEAVSAVLMALVVVGYFKTARLLERGRRSGAILALAMLTTDFLRASYSGQRLAVTAGIAAAGIGLIALIWNRLGKPEPLDDET
jgi:hypothetical protein